MCYIARMDFESYVHSMGKDPQSAAPATLAQWGVGYAKKIGLPNVCSLSSSIFTHGLPSYDPGVEFNRRYYSAPIDVATIAPYIAQSNGQEHKPYWFTKEDEVNVIQILNHAVVSWLLFSVNPYKYGGMNGHMVGVRTKGDDYEIWDTTLRKPHGTVNNSGLWKMCVSHMYGQNPMILTFR